jgi:hypothetical protein
MGWALASYGRKATLICANQVVQRVADGPIDTGRRRIEHFLIHALAGLNQQQSGPGLMTESSTSASLTVSPAFPRISASAGPFQRHGTVAARDAPVVAPGAP